MWSGVSVLLPVLMQIRPFMPSALKKTIDQMISPAPLTQKQHDKISALGESIGLSKDEIRNAVDTPGLDLPAKGMSKMALVSSVVIIVIAAAVVILGVWHIISPETSPIPTYAPGTDYGSIKPKDFDILNRDAKMHDSEIPLFYKVYPR
jgi:hypothetical protein